VHSTTHRAPPSTLHAPAQASPPSHNRHTLKPSKCTRECNQDLPTAAGRIKHAACTNRALICCCSITSAPATTAAVLLCCQAHPTKLHTNCPLRQALLVELKRQTQRAAAAAAACRQRLRPALSCQLYQAARHSCCVEAAHRVPAHNLAGNP
jgi:hypothetical protein